MEKLITILSRFLMIGIIAMGIVVNAQAQRVVSGTVTSADDGQVLPGVNIVIQGTTIGTVTDSQGEYEITIEDNSQVLRFSMVGFSTHDETVGTRSDINVTMQVTALELEDVVVTAFGIERERRSLGYATQSVRSDALTQAREPNIISNLRGRISGVDISQSPVAGGSAGILIRGVGSITGDNMPLIVVDGIPIDNQQLQPTGVGSGTSGGVDGNPIGVDYGDGIGGVRADDIENLTVLKGPNAAALYGARAANGVIVITTKTGQQRDGVGVEINSNVTFDRIGMRPQFQNGFGPGYGLNWEDVYETIEVDGVDYPLVNPGVDQHGPPLDGRMIILQNMPELGPIPATPQPNDNIYDFYNMGVTANNSIAFSGGDATTTWRLSFSDQRNEGVVPNSEFSSNTAALRVTSNLSDNLRVDGRANYYRHKGFNRPSLGGNFSNTFLNLILHARFVDLDWLKDYKRPDGTMVNSSSNPSLTNPYWIINERVNEDTRDRVYGFLSANYNLTDWLNLNVRAGTDTYYDQRFMRAPIGDRGAAFRDGRVENRAFRVQENNYDFLLSAVRDLGVDFSSSLSFGGNYLFRRSEQTGSIGTNLSIPGLYHISNANSIENIYTLSRREMQSLYALGQVGFRDYVYLDLSARNDWSSTLGLGNESFFYPAASVSFVFSDAFNLHSPVLTFGRLRASYARSGNDSSPYLTKAGYEISSLDYNGVRLATVPGQIPLLDLKNELTSSWEFGADIRLFENRLSLDIATYFATTENQIFGVPVSRATGYNTRLINAGQVDNRGIELSVNARMVESLNFVWDLGINASRNRSEVVELAPGVETHNLSTAGQVTLQARPGQPYGDMMGFVPMRTEDGRLILNENGTLRRAPDQEVIGNMQPDFIGGIVNEFFYRGFSLGAVIDYRIGGDLVSMTLREGFMKGTGIHTQHREEEMYFDGVIGIFDEAGNLIDTRENDAPVDPVSYYPSRVWGAMSSFWIVDGTYVSLNELTLGYNFSPSLLARTPFTSLRVSLVGRNIAYLVLDNDLRKMGVPPTSSNSRHPASLAYEENNFPLMRTIGFNINAQF